ncbi:MAG: hypothetical protein RJA19_857 [Bacteroidota bacterium]|jgi:glycosyltransferase involved in cell wall biosynthesis
MRDFPSASDPILSVVIPVRNARAAWRETWESLCALDAQGEWMEVVVVDGGSDDGTWEDLCAQEQQISRMGPRMILLQRPPLGIYDAMNAGAASAGGMWWTFMGAGERVNPHFDWRAWRDQASEDVLQVFSVDLLPPREPGVPASYPARWDASLRWRHTTHHQGIWYPANLLPLPPFDVRWKVLSDYDLHLHLFQAGSTAQCWPLHWVSVRSGGVSRRFDLALYREELEIKWRRLPLLQAAAVTPFILLKWLYKQGMRNLRSPR